MVQLAAKPTATTPPAEGYDRQGVPRASGPKFILKSSTLLLPPEGRRAETLTIINKIKVKIKIKIKTNLIDLLIRSRP